MGFIKSNDKLMPAASGTLVDHLEPRNYQVRMSMTGPFLVESAPFELPPKLYGKTEEHTARILNTYADRNQTTGVLLSGEKGSGKSLLAKNVAKVAAESAGWPTVIVTDALPISAFADLLQTIEQPCVVLLDEFEKTFDSDDQQELLTVMDGVSSSNKLFVLTVNEPRAINGFMHNRPSRLYYRLDFEGLDADFIREYCQDCLKNKDNIEDVVAVGGMFAEFNFDMLQAIVEEMNRYDETAFDAMQVLNARPEHSSAGFYRMSIYAKDGRKVKPDETTKSFHPTTQPEYVDWTEVRDDDEEPDEGTVFIGPHLLSDVDLIAGKFVWEDNDFLVVAERQEKSSRAAKNRKVSTPSFLRDLRANAA